MIFWRSNLLLIALLAAFYLPVVALADDGFVMLVGVPGLGASNVTDTSSYFTALYNLSIWIAAFLAVIKIIFAGVKYMFSEIADTKSAAKSDIQGAIVGLIIVLAAVLILNTINPNLTQFTLFQNVPITSEHESATPPTPSQPERLENECDAAASCSIMPCDPPGGPIMCQTTKEQCGREGGRGEIDTPSRANARLFCFK